MDIEKAEFENLEPVPGNSKPGSKAAEAVESPPQGFDFVQHEQVQDMRKGGIWTFLGDRFGGMEVRLRPFYEQAVVVKKEASEAALRMQLGLGDDEDLPGEHSIAVNKDAVTMAITGARARIRGGGPMLVVARKNGFKIEGDSWIVLTGDEEAEHVRELFTLMMDKSMHLLTTLVRASRGLHRVRDQEVARVGEGFVYGRHVKADWAD